MVISHSYVQLPVGYMVYLWHMGTVNGVWFIDVYWCLLWRSRLQGMRLRVTVVTSHSLGCCQTLPAGCSPSKFDGVMIPTMPSLLGPFNLQFWAICLRRDNTVTLWFPTENWDVSDISASWKAWHMFAPSANMLECWDAESPRPRGSMVPSFFSHEFNVSVTSETEGIIRFSGCYITLIFPNRRHGMVTLFLDLLSGSSSLQLDGKLQGGTP